MTTPKTFKESGLWEAEGEAWTMARAYPIAKIREAVDILSHNWNDYDQQQALEILTELLEDLES